MPCDSSYMEATYREKELQLTAKLLVFVRKSLGQDCPTWVKRAANSMYAEGAGDGDKLVSLLCKEIHAMTSGQRDKIIYDSHDKMSRKLADWWEEHQEADRKREKQEDEELRKESLRSAALKKLTKEEREALGCPPKKK